MKIKYLPAIFGFLVLTSPAAVAQKPDGFKPGGKLFGQLFANYHTTFSGGENNAEKVALYAIYDNINSVIPEEGTDPWNIDKDGSYLFAGIEFNPVPNIRISPNFIGYLPASDESEIVSTIGLNIEARF